MSGADRRHGTLRRDLNDLVRGDDGSLSPTKIGTLVGQWLSVKLILENGSAIIANWDSLTVLFSVLIAPELFKKLMNLKYGVPSGATVSVQSESVVTAKKTVTK